MSEFANSVSDVLVAAIQAGDKLTRFEEPFFSLRKTIRSAEQSGYTIDTLAERLGTTGEAFKAEVDALTFKAYQNDLGKMLEGQASGNLKDFFLFAAQAGLNVSDLVDSVNPPAEQREKLERLAGPYEGGTVTRASAATTAESFHAKLLGKATTAVNMAAAIIG